jgi:hypothetical protein
MKTSALRKDARFSFIGRKWEMENFYPQGIKLEADASYLYAIKIIK